MAFENFPYTNFHEINLDWIVARVKEAYSASNPPDYPVKSVNGMTGDVIIAIPANLVSSVNGETGDVVLYRNPLTQFPATDEQRWNLFRICDGDARGIEFDEDGAHRIEGTRRILIYDAENQPDYPVTSVNGQTGDVHISAGVNSVNGKTGNVVTPFINPNADILTLDSNSNTVLWGISRNVSGGNIALYITRGAGSPQAFIRYTPTEGEAINLPLLTNADIPESAGVISINTKTGAVTLYGTDIAISIDNATTLSSYLNSLNEKMNELYEGVYTIEPASILGWSRGSINSLNGSEITGSNHIRTDIVIPDTYKLVKSKDNLNMILLAWENAQYIGVYNAAEDTFAPQTGFYEYNQRQSFNIDDIRTTHPTYNFRLVARYNPIEAIFPEAAENIDLYKIGGGSGDIEALTQTVNEHTQQISALQSNDATQDQQISALENNDNTQDQQISTLQAKDTTQDQQIAALQTDDSAHAQQISELQSNDATHNQQISDLYNTSITQGNQINDLYTRTGVYGIFIENVNSLPMRYPASGTDPKIKSTNMVVSMDLYVSAVQVDAWTITTYDGYLEITGTMNGVSSMTLYLA